MPRPGRRRGLAEVPGVLSAGISFAYVVLGVTGLATNAGWGTVVSGPQFGDGVHLGQVGLGLLRLLVLRGPSGIRMFGTLVLVVNLAALGVIAGMFPGELAERLGHLVDLGWPGNAAYLVAAALGLLVAWPHERSARRWVWRRGARGGRTRSGAE